MTTEISPEEALDQRPPPFMLRPARPEDETALTELLTTSYSDLLAYDYAPRVLNAALPVIGRARVDLLTARDYVVAEAGDGQLIAAGGWTWAGPTGQASPLDWGHVRHVACHPDFAGQGIGGLILSTALDSARAAGVRVLSCMATLTAREFYRHMGFQDRGEVDLTLPGGTRFPAVEMRMVL